MGVVVWVLWGGLPEADGYTGLSSPLPHYTDGETEAQRVLMTYSKSPWEQGVAWGSVVQGASLPHPFPQLEPSYPAQAHVCLQHT